MSTSTLDSAFGSAKITKPGESQLLRMQSMGHMFLSESPDWDD
jgi:hypothetical protein